MKKVLLLLLIILVFTCSDNTGTGNAESENSFFYTSSLSFEEIVVCSDLTFPPTLAVGDLDNDGDTDIVSGISYLEHKIYYYLNDGTDKNFSRKSMNDDIPYNNFRTWIFDFNKDGYNDCLAISTSSEHAIYLNNKNGSFTETSLSETYHSYVLADDRDNDGDIDLFLNNVYLENDGSCNFSETAMSYYFNSADQMETADLNSDGTKDIVVLQDDHKNISYFLNNTLTTFSSEVSIADATEFFKEIRLEDLDKDGDVDIIGTEDYSDLIYWWENDGSLGFTRHTISFEITGPYGIETSDIDNDNDIDIIATYEEDSKTAVWLNDGSMNFHMETVSNEYGASLVNVTDFNSDGYDDIIVTYYNGVVIFLNTM